ncbi:MAG: hypothetical protein KKG33_04280 [candidate division Zixibacteria bacterium]|nr:hypothetical protein [candidate division Zixibacteria bacterium]MBU1470328.1 hypothetical protein [candidate division Zixibacteria bacterium]MBU2624763.1 hypothetical protein [candidate division Zixibacteria bacterium]
MGLFRKLFGGRDAGGGKSWEELNTEGARAIQDGRDSDAIRLLNSAIRS